MTRVIKITKSKINFGKIQQEMNLTDYPPVLITNQSNHL